MMELMNDLALQLNEERRREVALDTMRAIRAANALRPAADLTLVTIAAAAPQVQVSDCLEEPAKAA
jgi:hypothetical protein